MNRILHTLLLLTLVLGACSTPPSATEADSTKAPTLANSATEAAVVATPSGNSSQAEAGREAVVVEIENDVTVRSTSDEEFAPASVGMKIHPGGGLQTRNDSRARIDMMPEGTIIRVGPNSSFIVPEITVEDGEPKTTLALLFGKVYILLNGGSLDVKTPSGVASVRGSLLSVQYNPLTNQIRASCLEGHCVVENEEGEEVEVPEGESVSLDDEGEFVEGEEIDQDEVELWLEENPELDQFMEEMPNPEEYPDYQDDEWYWNEEDLTGDEWYWDESYQTDDEWYWDDSYSEEWYSEEWYSDPYATEYPTEAPAGDPNATEAPAGDPNATEPPAESPTDEPPTEAP